MTLQEAQTKIDELRTKLTRQESNVQTLRVRQGVALNSLRSAGLEGDNLQKPQEFLGFLIDTRMEAEELLADRINKAENFIKALEGATVVATPE